MVSVDMLPSVVKEWLGVLLRVFPLSSHTHLRGAVPSAEQEIERLCVAFKCISGNAEVIFGGTT